MDLLEFKFLLTLLGCPNYRSLLHKLPIDRTLPAAKRDHLCRQLCERDLVACTYEITQFKATGAGKALLKLKERKIPVAERELQILQASSSSPLTPAKLRTIPASERQAVLKKLEERGLIDAEKEIKEVWLADRGRQYLRDEYLATGSSAALARPVLSQDLLNHYLTFLRKAFREQMAATPTASNNGQGSKNPIDEKALLKTIRQLDKELGSDNYLPIFHIRQKLQPPLTRQDLDRMLYHLQRQDKLELSALQEAIAYTPEQIEAGIPQDIGGPLFFITVTGDK